MNKKILIVGSFPSFKNNSIIGGIARSCSEIIDSKHFSNKVILKIDSTTLTVPRPSLIIRLFFSINRVFKLIYILMFKQPSSVLVFCADGASAIEKGVMIIISKAFGAKTLIFPRAGYLINQVNKSKTFKLFIKALFQKTDLFLCQGEEWKSFASDVLKIQNSKIKIIRNWTASNDFLSIGSKRKIKNSKDLKLLYVGWLIRDKGVQELLNVFKILINKGFNLSLTLVGDGNYREKIEDFASVNKLNKHIKIEGWINRDKLKKFYQESDIFILPSWKEGMPNALIESLATGLPSVATSVGVIEDNLNNNSDVVIVPPKNENKLLKAIEMLIIDINFRIKLSKNGLIQVKKKFSSEQNLKELSMLLN